MATQRKRPTKGRVGRPAKTKSRRKRERQVFEPRNLDRTVIAIPLLRDLDDPDRAGDVFDVVIDLNLDFAGGREKAKDQVEKRIEGILRKASRRGRINDVPSAQYVFASLDAAAIRELVRTDTTDRRGGPAKPPARAIYHVWPDFPLKPLITRSISTIKADALRNAFAAFGDDITWAVVDSGVDASHPHFEKHKNLELSDPVKHRDFTSRNEKPLDDSYGHGTHVAGIIAGEMKSPEAAGRRNGPGVGTIRAVMRQRNEHGDPTEVTQEFQSIAGMAPRAKILSLKVLDKDGRGNGAGRTSCIIAALEYIHTLNGDGRKIVVHGVNLSVGYDFEPEWFACGQSPLCVEVNRLVRSGVVVVVAAGNSGYGLVESLGDEERVAAGLDITINDPGNADLAITVGSTHRDMPHEYGVSYFSSKGPTGDGRMKPDVLAPGEKIISCDSSQRIGASRAKRGGKGRNGTIGRYREDSGTSMAAPHVSGVIAAFLSIRHEFVGHPERVKKIFLTTATDLQRAPYFQGHGLVDVMRAIQSI